MLDSFKNSDLKIFGKYIPNYIISLPLITEDSFEIQNCVYVFYSVIMVPKSEFRRAYFNVQFREKLTKSDLELNDKDKNGFSPNGVFIIKTTKSDSHLVINDIKNSNDYFNKFSDLP